MKRLGTLLISAAVLSSLFTGCSSKISAVSGEDLLTAKNKNLIVQGTVETKEISINTKVPGKVAEVLIEEGAVVKKGDILLKLDNAAILAGQAQAMGAIEAATGQMNAAEGAKQAATATSEKAENGARVQEIAQAKAAFDYATTSYNRVKALVDGKIAPQSQLDEIAAKLEGAKQTYDMAVEGARKEDKAAAAASISGYEGQKQAAGGLKAQAEGKLQEVESLLNDSVITAPIDGTITTLNTSAGELVSTGMPICTISNLQEQWIEVNVKETDLGMVKLDKEVTVKLAAYPKQDFKGKIVRINKKPDFATKRATNDNGSFDILSYGVKIELASTDKTIYSGMTALIDFGKRDDK